MKELSIAVGDMLDGLYSDEVVDYVSTLADLYSDRKLSGLDRLPIPDSLKDVTESRKMSKPMVYIPDGCFDNPVLRHLGIVEGEKINGPLNHIITRMLTIPKMLPGYIDNYPTNPDELKTYTDPPLLQLPPDELKRISDDYFAQAHHALSEEPELLERFKLLGVIGEYVAKEVENVYPAVGSTQAYDLFGIFHLFPSNKKVDITSTSPGVILPTEADPLRFKDSVVLLKKNLLRPEYFSMLRKSIDIDDGRSRRYSANREGTANNLKAYPHLSDAAKEILSEYLKIRDRFEIRLGEQDPRMKLATLVGDIGIVYSIRDKEQKSKIAHNLTVYSPEEAKKYREIFDEQWERGEPITNTSIIDELISE